MGKPYAFCKQFKEICFDWNCCHIRFSFGFGLRSSCVLLKSISRTVNHLFVYSALNAVVKYVNVQALSQHTLSCILNGQNERNKEKNKTRKKKPASISLFFIRCLFFKKTYMRTSAAKAVSLFRLNEWHEV